MTLLVGRQEGHPACKNWVVGCWRGYLSGARWRLAYGPADATATHCLLLQEGHPACKNWVMGCWRGYLSGARCRLAYGPADATATHYSCFSKIQIGFTFLVPATWVAPEKGPLNGRVCVLTNPLSNNRIGWHVVCTAVPSWRWRCCINQRFKLTKLNATRT